MSKMGKISFLHFVFINSIITIIQMVVVCQRGSVYGTYMLIYPSRWRILFRDSFA